MEPFFVLLVLGAVVLIAITVVIVWPTRSTLQLGEAPTSAMSDNTSLPPQGDDFEDQYTSATADLSAGGVAAALQSEAATAAPVPPQRSAELRGLPTQEPPAPASTRAWPEADTRAEPIELPARAESFRYPVPVARPRMLMRPSPLALSIGIGAVLSLVTGVVGAWAYARWQRRRQQPIERLRRAQAAAWRLLNRR